jgi:hypothetical protein
MKSWILLPFVLLLGWVLGSWIPNSELRAARDELATVRKALKANRPSSTTSLTGVTQMLGLEAGVAAPVPPTSVSGNAEAPLQPAAEDERAGDELDEAVGVGAADANDDADADTDKDAVENDKERSMAGNIEQAMELWDARVAIARTTFVSNTALSQEEASHFDVLVDAMNIRLAHSIEQFAESVSRGEAVGEAEGVRLLRDMTTAMATTYDEMDGSMPEGWQSSAGSSFSLTDFVDPAVALPLTEVEGALDSGSFLGGRR